MFLKISTVLLFVSCLLSCEYDSAETIILSEEIVLSGEFRRDYVYLSWNRPYVNGFSRYTISRWSENYSVVSRIAYIEDHEVMEFKDYLMPFEQNVIYRIEARGNSLISSNEMVIYTGLVSFVIHYDDDVFGIE